MPKQENTAINHLIGYSSRKPIDDIEEPALFSTAPPAARLRPPPFGGNLSPIGASIAPLPRRRAPAATPPQVPLHSDYADDAATTVDPPAGWGAQSIAQPTPPPLPPMPPMPPLPLVAVSTWAAVQPVRPAYPAPHEPPAYYQAPLPDQTMRVRPMPLEVERSLGGEILEWVAKLWMPFVAVGVLAMTLGVYRLLNDKTEPPPITSEAAIVMTAEPVAAVAAEPVTAEPVVAEPIAAEPVAAEPIAAEPVVAADDHGVPKDSLWQPTKAQPTFAPRVETVAAIEPAIDIEPATTEPVIAERATARKPAARASSERSSSRRAAKRAAAKRASEQRAKQLALAELAPAPKAAKAPKPEVVAIAAAKPMKIGAASAASATGSGKLSVASTPSTLIYVDGRNTGMMTPKTLSLSEGSHKITLLSAKDRIAKTITVEIEAGKSSSLSKTFAR